MDRRRLSKKSKKDGGKGKSKNEDDGGCPDGCPPICCEPDGVCNSCCRRTLEAKPLWDSIEEEVVSGNDASGTLAIFYYKHNNNDKDETDSTTSSTTTTSNSHQYCMYHHTNFDTDCSDFVDAGRQYGMEPEDIAELRVGGLSSLFNNLEV